MATEQYELANHFFHRVMRRLAPSKINVRGAVMVDMDGVLLDENTLRNVRFAKALRRIYDRGVGVFFYQNEVKANTFLTMFALRQAAVPYNKVFCKPLKVADVGLFFSKELYFKALEEEFCKLRLIISPRKHALRRSVRFPCRIITPNKFISVMDTLDLSDV